LQKTDLIKEIALKTLKEKKGMDIKVLDISGLSLIADYFIIATASSNTLLQALARYLEDNLEKMVEVRPNRIEGFSEAKWILMDYNAVIIHLFLPEQRDYYKLERLWGDAKLLEIE